MDGMLSQEEINALLGGMGEDSSSDSSDVPATEVNEPLSEENLSGEPLSGEEKDAIGEISNISMGTAATTLSTLLSQRVNITTPNVSIANWNDISESYDRPCVFIQISYIEGLDGNNILILREKDVKIITDLMMGGTGIDADATELTELHLSAICEAMNQMMGSAATSISSVLEKKVDISPPTASLIDLEGTIDEEGLGDFLKDQFVKVAFRLPIDFAKELYSKFMASTETDQSSSEIMKQAAKASETPVMPQQAVPQAAPMPQTPPVQGYMQAPPVNVAPAQFQAFDTGINPLMQQENIGLIMDVPLEVTVELGRTNKTIKEILDFSPGTIIELNKLAGEAIDLLVNGKYVAKGEVVVIEDNFGIRITEIVK